MKNQIEIVKDIADGMMGIGGIPNDAEFVREFIFRIKNALLDNKVVTLEEWEANESTRKRYRDGIIYVTCEDAVDWLRREKRIFDTSPLSINGLELAKYLTEYANYKSKIIELATTIIDDVNWYGGANLVNGEIQHFEKLIGRQECYKTNKTCRHNCNGLCKDSC